MHCVIIFLERALVFFLIACCVTHCIILNFIELLRTVKYPAMNSEISLTAHYSLFTK